VTIQTTKLLVYIINAPVIRSGMQFDIPTVMSMTFKYSDGIFFDLLTVADSRSAFGTAPTLKETPPATAAWGSV
jgi:hypothetical protein